RGHHVVEARGPEGAEFQVAAFDPAELAQARAQRFKIRRRLARLPYAQPRNIANAIWLLLRTRHHWPRHGRAAEQGDDIATPHHPNSRTSVSPGTAQRAHRPPFRQPCLATPAPHIDPRQPTVLRAARSAPAG